MNIAQKQDIRDIKLEEAGKLMDLLNKTPFDEDKQHEILQGKFNVLIDEINNLTKSIQDEK